MSSKRYKKSATKLEELSENFDEEPYDFEDEYRGNLSFLLEIFSKNSIYL